ncbi:hypothetical protein BJX62DRAFT_240649 [Aspergillus germanicus]
MAQEKIGRRLVLCFDGTGNKYCANESDTNVVKIYEMLDRKDSNQYHYYQPGIGTFTTGSSGAAFGFFGRMKERFETILDQAIGTSFEYHVCKGYEFLMRYYTPGDYIYIFGFSRGAYTARFLAEMIHAVGLLSKGNEEMIRFAFATFSQTIMARGKAESNDEEMGRQKYIDSFKSTFCRADVKVYFLGLFDCVNSVGEFEIPFRRKSYRYIGKERPAATHIRHAVSIHERRLKFKPNLFLYDTKDPIDLKEVWFAGNHCDVGGGFGYEHHQQKHLLSDIPLAWMIDEILALDDIPEAKLGLDLSSMVQHGHLRAGHDELVKASKNSSDCHDATLRARQPHDFLAYGRGAGWYSTAAWWILETLPFFTRLELEHQEWVPRYWPPNLGASRDLPEDAVLHPSVQAMYRARVIPKMPKLGGDDPPFLEDPLRVLRMFLPWNLKKPSSIDLLGKAAKTKITNSHGAISWNLYKESGFTNCPGNILYMIFELLSPADHHALCLVNHKCRSIAERILYFKVRWNWQEGRENPTSPPGPPPITQLLRTLIARPQLASYIIDLHMEGTAYGRHEYRRVFATIPVPGPDELDGLTSAIQRTRVSFCETWIGEVRCGSIDGLVALLLSQVLNLKSLHLEGDFTRQTALIGLVLRAAIYEQPAGRYALPTFQHLREVSFLMWETEDVARDNQTKNTADILPLFYLPNLERLSAAIQNPPVQFTWPAASPPAPSKLTSLHLKILRQSNLGDLLAVTPNITSLRWEWYYDLCVEDAIMTNAMDMDLAPIPRALYPIRNTLTDLVIRPWSAIGGNDQFDPTIKLAGSLRGLSDFHRTLQVPWELLVGFAQDTSRRLQGCDAAECGGSYTH